MHLWRDILDALTTIALLCFMLFGWLLICALAFHFGWLLGVGYVVATALLIWELGKIAEGPIW